MTRPVNSIYTPAICFLYPHTAVHCNTQQIKYCEVEQARDAAANGEKKEEKKEGKTEAVDSAGDSSGKKEAKE